MVGIAEYKISNFKSLITLSLGSCLGIVLLDRGNKLAGLAHAMLPYYRKKSSSNFDINRFVDKSIENMLKDLIDQGAFKNNIVAKIVGGANMFNKDYYIDIGLNNIEAAKNVLMEYNIRIISADVGGTIGRTVIVNPVTGIVEIRVLGKKHKII